jgi:hypothetical protein
LHLPDAVRPTTPLPVMPSRLVLLLQVPATLAILAWLPTNVGKLAALVLVWAITFRRLSRPEALFFIIACLFFFGMNAASLKQGIFAFAVPDVLGMPWYELLMWGFYLLHTRRLLDGPAPQGRRATVWTLALLYSASFAAIPNATILFAVTGALLAIGLLLFHEAEDFAYVGYMVLLGAAVEYTGVHSGQWHYPGDPPGGVPIWFITLWGGVGLFLRRLALPILLRYEGRFPATALDERKQRR